MMHPPKKAVHLNSFHAASYLTGPEPTAFRSTNWQPQEAMPDFAD